MHTHAFNLTVRRGRVIAIGYVTCFLQRKAGSCSFADVSIVRMAKVELFDISQRESRVFERIVVILKTVVVRKRRNIPLFTDIYGTEKQVRIV